MLLLNNQRKHDTYLGIDPYHASAILDFKREAGRASKLPRRRMINVGYLSVIVTNGTIVSGIDLSYFNFPSDKRKRKRTPSEEYTQVHCLCPSSLVTNPKWRLRGKGVLYCSMIRTSYSDEGMPFEINSTERANRIAFLSLICYYRMKQP